MKSLDDLAREENTVDMKKRIKNLCKTCKQEGIILNPDKFTISRSINFGGFNVKRRIPEEDAMTEISPQNHQLNKVANFEEPRTRKEVHRFMGCLNILRNWTNKISASSPTLIKLMAGDTTFIWSDTAREEFETPKKIAGNLDFLSPYDEEINAVNINTDASLEGIGYVVYQKRKDGKRNITQMGSSSLKPNQTRWSTNELEALAVAYACKHKPSRRDPHQHGQRHHCWYVQEGLHRDQES